MSEWKIGDRFVLRPDIKSINSNRRRGEVEKVISNGVHIKWNDGTRDFVYDLTNLATHEAESKINHPAYYGGDTTYEAIKVIEAWQLDFCLGNTVKYISRAGKKQADKEIEDLEKAKWYLSRRIQQVKQGEELRAEIHRHD